MARPKPVAVLSVIFLAFLFILTFFFRSRIPDALGLAARYLGALAAVAAASFLRGRRPDNPVYRHIDVFMSLFVVLFTFDSMGRITHYINPSDKDPALAMADYVILGVHPGAWMERIVSPALTTFLQICYTSYYILPVTFCLILFFKGGERDFDRAVLGIVLGFFVSYVGYMVVPALGPRFYLKDLFHTDLMRGPLAASINDTLNMLEGENRDAFPSGHTEVVLIMQYYAWRYRRWFFWAAALPVAGLVFSTVYLRYHYAVDVFAGMLLAPLCVWAADRLYAMYSKAEVDQDLHEEAGH